MRVGFDVSPLVRPHPPGVRRAVEQLVLALERRGHLEVVRLAPEDGEDLRNWRHRKLTAEVQAQSLVGLHSPVSAFPRSGPGRRVQTIYELPWLHGVEENADKKHRFWAGPGSKRADRICVATDFVAAELAKPGGLANWLAPKPAKIRVCPLGVGAPFAEEPPPGVVDEAVYARYQMSDAPFALCLGATREKKNLPALLHGLTELHNQGSLRLQLLVTGPETPFLRKCLGLVSKLGLSRWVSTPGYLADEDLPSLLRLAACVPVLSHSEGFGLPVLEAMASGTPVIVPEHSAQTEVAGDAGVRCDPSDAKSVAAALQDVLSDRNRYFLPAVERAATFSWDRTAECVEKVWSELA